MTVPRFINIIMPLGVGEDDGDQDSVITVPDEDLYFWERSGDVSRPSWNESCRSPRGCESLPDGRQQRATDSPTMPKRRRSIVLSSHTLRALEALTLDDHSIDAQSFTDSYDGEDSLEPSITYVEQGLEKRSSDIPSMPQRRGTLVFENSDSDDSDNDTNLSAVTPSPCAAQALDDEPSQQGKRALRRRSQQMPPRLPCRKGSFKINTRKELALLRSQAEAALLSTSLHRPRVVTSSMPRFPASRTA